LIHFFLIFFPRLSTILWDSNPDFKKKGNIVTKKR